MDAIKLRQMVHRAAGILRSSIGELTIPFKFPYWTSTQFFPDKNNRAVVVVQLAERSPPTLEVRSSNPVMGKFYLLSTLLNLH